MEQILETVLREAENNFTYARELRRRFHRYPESARQEFQTAGEIERELRKFGLQTRRAAETGVYADIQGTLEGKAVIALRADIDALDVEEEHVSDYQSQIPGKMHACGHDAHAAALLAAARILCAHRNMFGGTVRLIFQPGEEIGYGARAMMEEGCLEGVDKVFGIHVASNVPVGKVVVMPGPNNASVDWFGITVHGKSAHVSTPERGVDALYIASRIVTDIQALITRRINPMENALIGIGKLQAGNAYNVVAAEARMEGTVRTFSPGIRKEIRGQIERIARLTAEEYGGMVSTEWMDYASPLINDPSETAQVQAMAAALFGKDCVITSRPPSLGGDDFAEFLLKAPGVYAYVGTANEAVWETTVSHHNGYFDIDERALVTASALYAAYAVSTLKGQ